MTYFEVLKEVQEATLTHERLLSKLRVELSKFSKCYCNEELVKDLIEDLRHNRRTYANLTTKNLRNMIISNVDDGLYTLVEYNVLVTLNNEIELLTKIYRYVQEGRMKFIILEEVLNDIESVNDIMNRLSKTIYATNHR